MTEKNREVDLSEILNRLGIGLHALGFIGAVVNLITGIVFTNFFFIFVSSPMALLIGWGLRWILSGETSNIIPFYESTKKPSFSEKTLNKLGIGLHVLGFIGAVFVFITVFVIVMLGGLDDFYLRELILAIEVAFTLLLIGWSFRWVLNGESSHFIPFYKEPKIVKETSRKKRLGIGLYFFSFTWTVTYIIAASYEIFFNIWLCIVYLFVSLVGLIGWQISQTLRGEKLPFVPFNKKFGIGVHLYFYIIASLNLILGILSLNFFGLLFGATYAALIGLWLRSIISREKTKMIDFYKIPKDLDIFF